MDTKQKPMSIQSDGIAVVAQQGIERALAARKHMVELSAEQTTEISGGLFLAADSTLSTLSVLRSPIIYGGPFSPVLNKSFISF